MDPDGLWFSILYPDGGKDPKGLSDEEARRTFLNPEWLQDMGYTVVKGVNEGGWLTGAVYNSEGQRVFSFTRISWDDLTPFANGVFDQAEKITKDPVVWATIGAFKVYGRAIPKRNYGGARRAEKPLAKQSVPSMSRDATGKVHGELPNRIPKNWTREQLQESAAELRSSIQRRQAEQVRLGEEGGHRARIQQEQRLLRQIEKKLSGS